MVSIATRTNKKFTMEILKLIPIIIAILVSACGGSSGGNNSTLTDEELLADRPFEVLIPASYDMSTATPLVVVLHGFGGNGGQILSYFRLAAAAERHGFLAAYPDGTRDFNGIPHWNATNACCGIERNPPPDDVRYLSVLLDDIEANYNVDSRRIYFIGSSNGAFMSHRMACDRSNRVAAIVALAGVPWNDPDKCQTEEPVSILQVHGDLDNAILYGGGFIDGVPYPSAIDTVSEWATRNGCNSGLVDSGTNINIDVGISGNETRVQQFTNCPTSGEVELWTILGGGHVPSFDDSWPDSIWGFLSNHPKP